MIAVGVILSVVALAAIGAVLLQWLSSWPPDNRIALVVYRVRTRLVIFSWSVAARRAAPQHIVRSP